MSLTVHLPPKASRSRRDTLELPPFDPHSQVEVFTVQNPCLLESSRRFHVFSGSLVSSSSDSPPIPVVCKLSYGPVGMDRLMGEAMIYDDLRNLQGKVVPRCYGYFEDSKIAGCLVLEHAGQALQTRFEYLDDELKIKIMDAFDQIHKAGVEHDDIAERNVLINEQGRVSIIDFEEAFEMPCRRCLPIPRLGDLCPDVTEFGCEELYDLGWSLKMWRPRVMEVFGHVTPIRAFNDHDGLIASRPSWYSEGRAEQEAHYLWLEYIKEWFPEEYAEIPNDGQWYWPIIDFDCEEYDDDDEDLEVFASNDQNSDPLGDDGSDHSSRGSQQ